MHNDSSPRRRPHRLAALAFDARHALRAVRKDVRLFAIAVAIIGLGVGACTAVWSVLNPLLVRDLPFADPEALVWVANNGEGGMSSVTSRSANLRNFRAQSQAFDGLTGFFAFFEHRTYTLVGDGEPIRLVGVPVAQDFLDVLGVRPQLGRSFVPAEGLDDGPAVVILTDTLWQRQFGADPDIIGRAITIAGEPREVVGVLPPTFDFASFFAPHTRIDFLSVFPISDQTDRWGNTLSMVGRLAPGATVASAQADLERIIAGIEQDDPERWGLGAAVTGLQAKIAGPIRAALLLLAAAAGAVMLIVCVNLSNLLLAKSARRGQEMAVRSALGASRARLVRQLLFESLLLGLGGAVVGIGLAWVATGFIARTEGLTLPLLRSVAIDGQALTFSIMVALVAGLAVGIVPALSAARNGEATAFRSAQRGATASRRSARLRASLVVVEVALACVLLVFGGLLMRSFQNVLDVDLGFRASDVTTWKLDAPRDFETLTAEFAFFDQIAANVEAIPGVTSVGLTDAMPLGRNRSWGLRTLDEEDEGMGAFVHLVDHRYFETLRIPLVSGRAFSDRDTASSGPVVILNETAARQVYGGEDPLGRRVVAGGTEAEVIGIVADIRHRSLESEAGAQMYLPMMQINDFSALDLAVRSTLPPETLAASVAGAIHAVDPAMPTSGYRSLEGVVDQSVSPRRFTLQLLVAFAVAALLLAALGIYGVLSCVVSERIPEIGIRMALGETRGGVLRRVVRQTLTLAAIGLALGALGSVVVSRSVAALLYGVEAFDPATFGTMGVLMLVVASVAGLIPALRAARTSAASVLRQ